MPRTKKPLKERLKVPDVLRLQKLEDELKGDISEARKEAIVKRLKYTGWGLLSVACIGTIGLAFTDSSSSGVFGSGGSSESGSSSGGGSVGTSGEGGNVGNSEGSVEVSESPTPSVYASAVGNAGDFVVEDTLVDLSTALYVDGTPFTEYRFPDGSSKPSTIIQERLSNYLTAKYNDGARFYPAVGYNEEEQAYYLYDSRYNRVFLAKETTTGTTADNRYSYIIGGNNYGMQGWVDLYKVMPGQDMSKYIPVNGILRSIPTSLVTTQGTANSLNSLQLNYPSNLAIFVDTSYTGNPSTPAQRVINNVRETNAGADFKSSFKIDVIYVSTADYFKATNLTYENWQDQLTPERTVTYRVDTDGSLYLQK